MIRPYGFRCLAATCLLCATVTSTSAAGPSCKGLEYDTLQKAIAAVNYYYIPGGAVPMHVYNRRVTQFGVEFFGKVFVLHDRQSDGGPVRDTVRYEAQAADLAVSMGPSSGSEISVQLSCRAGQCITKTHFHASPTGSDNTRDMTDRLALTAPDCAVEFYPALQFVIQNRQF
jgi:hypothetical protein